MHSGPPFGSAICPPVGQNESVCEINTALNVIIVPTIKRASAFTAREFANTPISLRLLVKRISGSTADETEQPAQQRPLGTAGILRRVSSSRLSPSG